MEAKRKGRKKDEEDRQKTKKGLEDILEDDDVLPNAIKQSHVEEKVDPGKSDGEGGDLPLAT